MTTPTSLEQFYLELINEARLDPQQSVARFITSFAPLTSSDPGIQAAFTSFHVDGAALQSALALLTPVRPLAWNDGLGTAARNHSDLMMLHDEESHQLLGESSLYVRIPWNAGWQTLGENLFATASSALHAHARFLVDWANAPDGMAAPAERRSQLMNPDYREIGIGVIIDSRPATSVGPEVVTEVFGRSGKDVLVLGVAYSDADGDGFYSVGEGIGGMVVADSWQSVTTAGSGGYSLVELSGSRTLTFTEGQLTSPVIWTTTLLHGANAKIDIVDGTTLKTSVSGTLSGPISRIEGLGTHGLTLTGDDHDQVIVGTRSDDTLVGAGGNDQLFGGAGSDVLNGGAGADKLDGGEGMDTVSYAGGAMGVTVRLDLGSAIDAGGAQDTLINVEGAIGTGYADLLVGSTGGDVLVGGAGNDMMQGGAGDDTYEVDAAGDVVVENPGEGVDTIRALADHSLPANVEVGVLAGHENTGLTGNDLNNALTGNDQYLADSGNNVLDGAGGDDTLDGGTGVDVLRGGAGNDTYIIDDSAGGRTALVLVSEPGEWGGQGLSYVFDLDAGAQVVSRALDGDADGGVDLVQLSFSKDGVGFALNFSTRSIGQNLLPGAYLDATRGGDAGHPSLDVYGNGRGVSPGFGSFTVFVADFDFSGDTLRIDNLSIEFEQRGGSPTAPALRGMLNLNASPGANARPDTVIEDADSGIDTVSSSITYTLPQNVEVLQLTGADPIAGYGNDLVNTIVGNDAGNVLDGGLGADDLQGGDGDDIYHVDDAGDVVAEGLEEGLDEVRSTVSFVLPNNIENLTLTGAGDIDATGNAADNVLSGNTGINTLQGLGGDDTYFVDGNRHTIAELPGGGHDVVFSTACYVLSENVEDLTLLGSGNLAATGNQGDNALIGTGQYLPGSGRNVLTGGAGNDRLDGKTGYDELHGGPGDDTYVIEHYAGGASSLVIISSPGDYAGQGLTYEFHDPEQNFEPPQISDRNGDGAIDWLGAYIGPVTLEFQAAAGDNLLVGTYASASYGQFRPLDEPLLGVTINNRWLGFNEVFGEFIITGFDVDYSSTPTVRSLSITFEQHVDRLSSPGLVGTYNYQYAPAGPAVLDSVVEAPDEGTDTVEAAVDYVLGPNVENLVLLGDGNLDGTGNEWANVIEGNAGANRLVGGARDDELIGRAGDDELLGDAGADLMRGGPGNDRYVVDDPGDQVIEATDEGIDIVESAVTLTLSANVENITLTGDADIDATGNDLDNILTSNAGQNVLAGQDGDDRYILDSVADQVVEAADAGFDRVDVGETYTLPANVEELRLTGSANIDGTGNDLDNWLMGTHQGLPGNGANVLIGGDGNDILDGLSGYDTLMGGRGDDHYWARQSGGETALLLYYDSRNLLPGAHDYSTWRDGGIGAGVQVYDTDQNGFVDYLELNFHANLVRISTRSAGDDLFPGVYDGAYAYVNAIGGLGVYGESNNVRVTVEAMDVDHSTGTSVLLSAAIGFEQQSPQGFRGLITYHYAPAGPPRIDRVVENADEGVDTVHTDVSYILPENVENLTLFDTNIWSLSVDGTGNGLANVLIGNRLSNSLRGGAGDDQLSGAGGNDTLDGESGVDRMIGGLGDDAYFVDDPGDTVEEDSNGGIDHVLVGFTYTLSDNVENVTLTGTADIDATGNALDNVLAGNTGVNTLTGGAGNDTYDVDSNLDRVIELPGEGRDLVRSSVSYVLPPNVEDLTLVGTANLDGSGNDLDNVLTGNGGVNHFAGGAGDDTYYVDPTSDAVFEAPGEGVDTIVSTVAMRLPDNVEHLRVIGNAAGVIEGNSLDNVLIGNAAVNTMIGHDGDDVYEVDHLGDVITEQPGEGIDTVRTLIDNYTLPAWVENLELLAGVPWQGVGNALGNRIVANGRTNRLTGLEGDDTYIVDSRNDEVVETPGGGNDTVESSDRYTLPVNVENLRLVGAANVEGTGNDANNVIVGNAGNNLLNGKSGADLLDGGAGDDTLDGGADADTLDGGEGTDVVTYANATTGAGITARLDLGWVRDPGGALDTLFSIEGVIGTNHVDVMSSLTGVANTLVGNGGDDYLFFDAMDVISGGWGVDRAVAVGGAGLDLALTDIEWLWASDVGDFVNASSQTATVTIFGLGGNDTITGGSAADQLFGQDGADTLIGGQGNDWLYIDSLDIAAGSIHGGLGSDRAASLDGSALSIDLDATSIEWVWASNHADELDGRFQNEAVYLFAFDGADTMRGGIGNDNLYGMAGADAMYGGAGDDVLYFDSDDTVVDGGPGYDTAQVLDYTGVGVALDLGARQVEAVYASNQSDILDGSTATWAVFMNGYDGDDVLSGGSGDDNIYGGGGADTISGGGGNDFLDGSGGAETDTLAVSGQQAQYTLHYTGGVLTSVQDLVGSRDGWDNIAGFEQIRFADGVLIL